MSDKKPMKVIFSGQRPYGKSVESVSRMLSAFDPNIHDKIEISILSSHDKEKIQELESKLKKRDELLRRAQDSVSSVKLREEIKAILKEE